MRDAKQFINVVKEYSECIFAYFFTIITNYYN